MTAFTLEQRAVVERRSGSVLVSANAGSGKTSVMVERFVAAVLEDPVPVDAILAITFTDKAAAQLRARIRTRFVELGEEAAARAMERAQVSTIHGFCARVLRGNAVAAGLDPDFQILDDVRAARLARAAFALALDELVVANGDAATELIAAYTAETLRETVVGLHDRLRSAGETRPVVAAARPRDIGAALDELRAALPAAAACVAQASNGQTVAQAAAAVERAAELVDVAPAAEHPRAADAAAAMLPSRAVAALDTPACDRYRSAVAGLRAACLDREALPVHALLGELLERHAARYAEAKGALSRVDFSDLELMVRDLFRARPALADAVGRRYDAVLVDEFQDTNRVQFEILEAIDRDNRCVVGDTFQSIYRFRHADVELFDEERARLATRDGELHLSTNFRSAEPLLDAINAAVGDRVGPAFIPLRAGRPDIAPDGPPALVELLVTDSGGWKGDEDHEPVDFGATLPGSVLWRVAEARLLGQRLRDLLDDTRYEPGDVAVLLRATADLPLFERALEEEGVPTYLIGGRGYFGHPQVRDLVAWLSVLANPDDEPRLWEVLASPMVGLGTGGLVLVGGAAAREGRTPWWLLRAAVGGDDPAGLLDALEPADREKIERFVGMLASERAGAPRRSLDGLIERALERTGYDVRMLALPGGQRRLANVRKLMRLAREHENSEGRDLRGFLDLVAELSDERVDGDREGEAPLHGEDDGAASGQKLPAVRLMTVHRAKGLEFPFVCVADLGRRPPSPGHAVVLVGSHPDDARVGIKLRSLDEESVGALEYDALLDEEKAAAEAEERRLVYVAVTRAQERLILSGAVPVANWPDEDRPGAAPIAWVGPAFVPGIAERLTVDEPALDDDGELAWEGRPVRVQALLNARDTLGRVLRSPIPEPLVGDGAAAANAAPEPVPPSLPRPVAPVDHVSYSALEQYDACGYRFYLERVLGLPGTDPVSGPDPATGLDARLRGTIAHALLERIDFAAPAVPDGAGVRDVARGCGTEPTEAEAEELRALVAAFAGSELCARLAAASDVRREAPFAYPLHVGEEEGLLVNGVVDVIANEGDRALIVDYKSDRLPPADAPGYVDRHYGTQRLVYALAALRGGAAEAVVVHCLLERPGEPVAATFRAADQPELERHLAGLADRILREEFDVSPRPNRELCAGCPGRGSLCSWPLEQTMADPPPD
jgi:ATP-dependent exoDNAse (exonuclease V) beta subunit